MRPLLLLAALAAVAHAGPRDNLKTATLAGAPADHQRAIGFLIDNMPDADVTTLNPACLRANVALAYQARSESPWAGAVPEEIFFNNVLPYAVLDEARDDWRAGLLTRFRKHVAGAQTLREAIIMVNGAIANETGVRYNTQRRAPNQGPVESMKSKMASCSGLSILLVDALRAVGIPARLAGTAMWTTKPGNHTWVEVWLPDAPHWQAIEYGGGSNDFNRGWFITDAARAIPGSIVHGVFATSWKPTGSHFPIAWAIRQTVVSGVDVTNRYLELGKDTLTAVGQCELRIDVMAHGESGSTGRRPMAIRVLQGDVLTASGQSPTQTDDLNRFFTVKVKQGQLYQVVAFKDGKPAAVERIEVGGKEACKQITLRVAS